MAHNPAAAWADFVSQPLFLPGNNGVLGGGGNDLHQYGVDGDFIKLCRAADAFPPPESGPAGGVASQCKPAADLVAQQDDEGAAVRSFPALLEPKGGGGAFAADPAAMGPVMDFMEAILGSSSTSAVSATSVESFSASTGMQSHCWIP